MKFCLVDGEDLNMYKSPRQLGIYPGQSFIMYDRYDQTRLCLRHWLNGSDSDPLHRHDLFGGLWNAVLFSTSKVILDGFLTGPLSKDIDICLSGES